MGTDSSLKLYLAPCADRLMTVPRELRINRECIEVRNHGVGITEPKLSLSIVEVEGLRRSKDNPIGLPRLAGRNYPVSPAQLPSHVELSARRATDCSEQQHGCIDAQEPHQRGLTPRLSSRRD